MHSFVAFVSVSTLIKELFTLLDLCVSSLRRGHANLLCIVPILTDDPRRESKVQGVLQVQRVGNLEAMAKYRLHVINEYGKKSTESGCSPAFSAARMNLADTYPEVTAEHCPVLLALSPAYVDPWNIIRQQISLTPVRDACGRACLSGASIRTHVGRLRKVRQPFVVQPTDTGSSQQVNEQELALVM